MANKALAATLQQERQSLRQLLCELFVVFVQIYSQRSLERDAVRAYL